MRKQPAKRWWIIYSDLITTLFLSSYDTSHGCVCQYNQWLLETLYPVSRAPEKELKSTSCLKYACLCICNVFHANIFMGDSKSYEIYNLRPENKREIHVISSCTLHIGISNLFVTKLCWHTCEEWASIFLEPIPHNIYCSLLFKQFSYFK